MWSYKPKQTQFIFSSLFFFFPGVGPGCLSQCDWYPNLENDDVEQDDLISTDTGGWEDDEQIFDQVRKKKLFYLFSFII